LIITRSPLRITLGGGGTDLPSYYRRFGGFCISAAIDKYVYITLHENFRPEIILKYSEMERVERWENIKNPIIKQALELVDLERANLEICSMSDIPGNTGLGSSSAFTCAVLRALHAHKNNLIQPSRLAEQACYVERSNPGQGDQYASAIGGVNSFKFRTDGYVEAMPLEISVNTIANLEDNLLLMFTGFTREAADILSEQNRLIGNDDPSMLEAIHQMKSIGEEIHKELKCGNMEGFAELLNVHWREKKKRSLLMSTPEIDDWYEYGLKYGALGGKLVGAGGGGFLLFYCSDKPKCRHAMTAAGLREVRFRFDFEGTKVLNL
jgi:D-glycero-alpha-D-manno-heptose-7-phosphate kinase